MELVLLFLLFTISALFLILVYRIVKWIFAKRKRMLGFFTLLLFLSLGLILHKLFFQKMHFVPSKVYSNLYLLKYPEERQVEIRQAIRDKIKEHVKSENTNRQKLAYSDGEAIYFYEYYKNFALNIFQDAGTAYFIENEEDLGGFVSEELGMYTQYRLAEFYYEPCKTDTTLICGEVNFFIEGEFDTAEQMNNLNVSN